MNRGANLQKKKNLKIIGSLVFLLYNKIFFPFIFKEESYNKVQIERVRVITVISYISV